MTDLFNYSGAEFSKCGKYRYKLWRVWDASLPVAMCIGLNPSTANSAKDDPTINNLRRILMKLGFGAFYMTNLFAWISSRPKDLLIVADPIGNNDQALSDVRKICDVLILCWGNFKQAEQRISNVLPNYPNAKCFGFNKNGTPLHPLALMYNGTIKNPELLDYDNSTRIF